jgi:hypothetical protein
VHSEVDQDVDSIRKDHRGQSLIGDAVDVVPMVDGVAMAVGDRVGPGDAGVAVDFESLAIVMLQKGEHEVAFRLEKEIGRNVADPKSSVGVGSVRVGRHRGAEG